MLPQLITAHEIEVQAIQERLKKWRLGESIPSISQASISNTMRNKPYQVNMPTLGLHQLKRVLSIDQKRCTAWVEPGLTMEELVDVCLPLGLMPAVLPEFRGITVGGAINGGALESASHRYGQFNDICLSYEVLLGDGQVLHVSPQSFPELFYAIGGSYGTLGFILSVELSLIPVTGWVHLTYSRFTSYSEALAFMRKLHHGQHSPDFLEAIVYGSDKTVVIWGHHCTADHAKEFSVLQLKRYFAQWFYSHVAKKTEACSQYEIVMPLKDYIFRHDRGAFWMAGFALHFPLLLRYLIHKFCKSLHLDMNHPAFTPYHCTPKNPGKLFRGLFGKVVESQTLYASLHGGSEKWFEKYFVIQDFYIPESFTTTFIKTVLDECHITPLWLCPIKATPLPQLFAPHFLANETLLFDVGVYGIPATLDAPSMVRKLEQLTYQLNGKKMFYSHNYLSKKEFSKFYPLNDYKVLRTQCRFEGKLPDIIEKVIK